MASVSGSTGYPSGYHKYGTPQIDPSAQTEKPKELPPECKEMDCDHFPTSGPLTYEQRQHQIRYHGDGR